MTARLVPVNSVRPSTYNPRKADPARLDLVRLSLGKIGFVLPIVADLNGEIISGHQRHHVAKELGFTQVPVAFIPAADEAARKGLNIVFNRGTNDMSVTDHSGDITLALAAAKVHELAEQLPDGAKPFRCIDAEQFDISKLAGECRGRYDSHMRNMARALYARAKFKMPIVATASGRVVNGVGRVQYGMESGRREWPVVWVSEAEADFAAAMLNLLSMDFNIHEKYADVLRHNSFRRPIATRKSLGTGFTFALPKPPKKTDDFDISDPMSASLWRRVYGRRVADFGAGHMHETEMLRAAGVKVSAFEPYRCAGSAIDKAESVRVCREFLEDIAQGQEFDSVFLSSVLNSVPFREDREKLIRLCAALCGVNTVFYTNPLSIDHDFYSWFTGANQIHERADSVAGFALDYEPGILLGNFMDKPKVQKFHTAKEVYDLVSTGFQVVEVKQIQKFHATRAIAPRPPETAALRAAIEFEFDLPYPDGSRMGLVREALDAFGQRLGMDL